jgi:oligoendopeptidase F
MQIDRVPERDEVEERCHWDLSTFYKDSSWERDFERIDEMVKPIEEMRSRLSTHEDMVKVLSLRADLMRFTDKLYTYASLRADEDTRNSYAQARKSRMLSKSAEVNGKIAWIEPEILSNPAVDEGSFGAMNYHVKRIVRMRGHLLSADEEALIARASDIFSSPYQTFNFLAHADMRFPTIADESGREVELSEGRYISFLQNRDRRVRRDAFNALLGTYGSFKNTLACTLAYNVKANNYLAESHHFQSALEAALHEDNVPVELYNHLIETTHGMINTLSKYLELKREALGLEELDMYDLYVPIVHPPEMKLPFERAKALILEACKPLGEDYCKVINSAFERRWIDVYENRGKMTGAYSSGCYDSDPYILLNYRDDIDSTFTLAHELGHSMHTYLANRAQPYIYSRYPIFIAEIPSTLNEALLQEYLIRTTSDLTLKAYLLSNLCESFRSTVYRQVMFAEFEKLVHEMDAEGEPLTSEKLSDTYYRLNSSYYPVINGDRTISMEWARIPHFYYNFYVYKYATSFCASQLFVERVLEGEKDGYIEMLSAGGSDDPLEIIKRGGVDMMDRKIMDGAFNTFDRAIGELKGALQELGTI